MITEKTISVLKDLYALHQKLKDREEAIASGLSGVGVLSVFSGFIYFSSAGTAQNHHNLNEDLERYSHFCEGGTALLPLCREGTLLKDIFQQRGEEGLEAQAKRIWISLAAAVKWAFKDRIRSTSTWFESRVRRPLLLEKLTLQEFSLVIGSLREFLNEPSRNFNPNQGRDWENFMTSLKGSYNFKMLAILGKMGAEGKDLILDDEFSCLTEQFKTMTLSKSTSLPNLQDLRKADLHASIQRLVMKP